MTVDWCVLNFYCVVWTEKIWCVFTKWNLRFQISLALCGQGVRNLKIIPRLNCLAINSLPKVSISVYYKSLTVVYNVDTFLSAVCVIHRNWYHGKHLTAKVSQGPLKKKQQIKTSTPCTASAQQKWAYDNTTQLRACLIRERLKTF